MEDSPLLMLLTRKDSLFLVPISELDRVQFRLLSPWSYQSPPNCVPQIFSLFSKAHFGFDFPILFPRYSQFLYRERQVLIACRFWGKSLRHCFGARTWTVACFSEKLSWGASMVLDKGSSHQFWLASRGGEPLCYV